MSKQHEITAIIYDKRGKVLSIGKNTYTKTHPLQAEHAEKCGEPYKIFMHAEVHAITRLSYKNYKKAHRIEIFRYLESGEPGSAKPCPICCSAIKAANIKVITHT